MERVNYLVEKTWARLQTLPPDKRWLIAVSGIPGSGKTTLAQTVTLRLNSFHTKNSDSSTPIAANIPMDGYHLSRAQLAAMPNSEEAIFRRGAAFTFDAESYLRLVQTLRNPLALSPDLNSTPVVYAPSFSHALKDPVDNDIPIPPTSRILIFEGLYLSLDHGAWKEAGDLMDEHWFVEVGYETAAGRLVKRHMESGICESEEFAKQRVWESDLRNGREIVEGRRHGVDEIVKIQEDGSWE